MIEIREAKESDFDAMSKMKAAAWQESYLELIPEDIVKRQSDAEALARIVAWWKESAKHHETFYLASQDNAIVGIAAVSNPPRDHDVPVALELTMLYLRESEKGRGTANLLLNATVGNHPCLLWVLRDNHRAIRFYQRHGFAPDGAAKPAFAAYPAIEEIRMVRLPRGRRSPLTTQGYAAIHVKPQ